MNKISKELVEIAKQVEIAQNNDPGDFDNFKKYIMNFCEQQIKNFQELNYFCQQNYNALNQNIDIFDDIQNIGQLIQKMLNKARMARRIKK